MPQLQICDNCQKDIINMQYIENHYCKYSNTTQEQGTLTRFNQ